MSLSLGARRIAIAAVGAVLVGLILRAIMVSRIDRGDAWYRVQETGILRVGMDASFPPFESVDADGRYIGYDVDLAGAIGERWGVEVRFVNIAFDGLYDALLAGRLDVILSALPQDPLLTRDVLYSKPYFLAGQVIVAPSLNPVSSPDELRDRAVAVELGADGHAELVRLNRDRGLDVHILARPSLQEALATLAAGEAHALVCDRVDALPLTASGGYVIGLVPLSTDPYVAATGIGSPRLAAELDDALEALRQDGTLAQMQNDWLGR